MSRLQDFLLPGFFPIFKPEIRVRKIEAGLSKILGQEEAKSQLFDVLFEALEHNQHLCPRKLLFAGPPSAGKTTCAKIVVENILEIPLAELDGEECKNLAGVARKIMEALAKAGRLPEPTNEVGDTTYYTLPPMGVFIDEAHRLDPSIQNALLKCTEGSDGMMITQKLVLNCKNVLWILGTTDRCALIDALSTRFTFIIKLFAADAELCSEILQRENRNYTKEVSDRIVYYAGPIPRVAKIFAEKVRLYARSRQCSLMEAVESVARRDHIDECGMPKECLDILKIVARYPKGIILRELSSFAHCEPKELQKAWLPRLLSVPSARQQSLIAHDGGYFITQEGANYLKSPYPLNVKSQLIATYTGEVTVTIEQFSTDFYLIRVLDVNANVVDSHRSRTLDGAFSWVDSIRSRYKLGVLPCPSSV